MTLIAGAPSPTTAAGGLPTGRPLLFLAFFAAQPIAWAVGVAPFIWPVAGFTMFAWLLHQRQLVLPRGFGLWALFLVVMAASVLQVEGVGRLAVFLMRASWYVSAGVMVVYLVNHRRGWATAQTIVAGLLALWAGAVVLGYAALVWPSLEWSSPLVSLLPGALASDPYVADLTTSRLAEVQAFSDATLGRPAAPFPYTNSWGSTLALLTPIGFLALTEPRLRMPRGLVFGLLVASVPPLIASLNRGAWLSIGLALAYAAALRARERGSLRPLIALGIGVALAGVVLVSTGTLASVTDQLETRTADSNDRRATLYQESWNGALESPILGFGTPLPSDVDPEGPPVGTHGQLWMTMFSHGLLGSALYVGFFFMAWLRTPWRTHRWHKVALLVFLAQMPIYGQLPHQLFIGMAIVALTVVTPDRSGTERTAPALA